MTTEMRRRFLTTFERVYVINLPYRTDRRRQMAAQLALLGLSFDDPAVTLVSAIRPDAPGKWPTIGARGCFESHQKVLRLAQSDAADRILILEDDVDWSPNFLAEAPALLSEIDALGWDILHGGIDHRPGRPVFRPLASEEQIPLTHFMAFRGALIPALRAHLDLIAGRDVGDPRGGPMHVDGAYNWFRKDHPDTKAFLAEPSIAEQRASRTDIHPLPWSDRIPGIAQIKNALRPGYAAAKKLLKPR